MVIVYCILIAMALMAQVSAKDPLQPLDNPYRVSDIFHSFGQALKGATKKGQSGIQSEQLSELFTQWLIEIKGTTTYDVCCCCCCLFFEPLSLSALYPTAETKVFPPNWDILFVPSGCYIYEWPPAQGLVSDEEVHQAAPEGMYKLKVSQERGTFSLLHLG